MTRVINVDIIYYISNFLNTKEQKQYLSTDKESAYGLQFDVYKKKLIATKIQRWWRKHFCAPTIISGCYGYTISYKKLLENWERFRGRQVQFAQRTTMYNYVNGNLNNFYDSRYTQGVIYTLTCLDDIVYNNDEPYICVGYPGFYNMNPKARSINLPTHFNLHRNIQTRSMSINENFIFNKKIYMITHCDFK
tara:strand:- start:41 stop:616 length:576 start_codon:yes stop_codon:yes gene_type:complete